MGDRGNMLAHVCINSYRCVSPAVVRNDLRNSRGSGEGEGGRAKRVSNGQNGERRGGEGGGGGRGCTCEWPSQ